MKKYYQMMVDEEKNTAEILIFGDITSWEWLESDVSSFTLTKEIQSLPEEIDTIKVYINSYGGEVGEGLAIYNELKRHKAKVITYCDGFAASIASVIFMAGDERVMNNASLLFVHNAWSYCSGNSNDLKKAAEDLEKITQASVNAYLENVSISEDELKEYMDAETWLSPMECLDMGFCTSIEGKDEPDKATQSVRKAMFEKLTSRKEPEQKVPEKPEGPKDPEQKESNLMLNILEKL